MSNITLHLKDSVDIKEYCNLNPEMQHSIADRLKGGIKKTKIKFINHDTGELIDEVENKVLLSGSQFNAMSIFGIDTPAVAFETYNTAMNLDKSVPSGTTKTNAPIVCLFSIADGGCGTTHNSIAVTHYTDRITPAPASPSQASNFNSNMIMPFRFVKLSEDLDSNLRQYYYGRKVYNNLKTRDGATGNWIGYYFKKFDSDPMLHLRYADGTDILPENVYSNVTMQTECYVELRLRITRLDFRDYFEQILGWDKARISQMSLDFAWYNTNADGYKYYQDITSYSLLNFDYKELNDLTVAMDILYEIYY